MVYELTSSKLQKAILLFSKENTANPSEVQILIFKKNEDLEYRMCIGFNPISEVSLKKILNIPIDLLGMEKHTKNFLQESISEFAQHMNVLEKETFIFISNAKPDLEVVCFHNSEFKWLLSLKEHFKNKGII